MFVIGVCSVGVQGMVGGRLDYTERQGQSPGQRQRGPGWGGGGCGGQVSHSGGPGSSLGAVCESGTLILAWGSGSRGAILHKNPACGRWGRRRAERSVTGWSGYLQL